MSKPAYDTLDFKHVDGFDFDPSKAIKQKIIKETTTDIEFLDQFRPAYSILSGSAKMARETVFERLGKLGRKVIKKVGKEVEGLGKKVEAEIQNVLGIVTICIRTLLPHEFSSYHMKLLFNE